MKACPVCGRLYPEDAGFCPTDGRELVSATQAPMAAADGDARIGQMMCSRYEVRRVVADGGMGRVYEALDMVERRNVALKILHPDVATDAVSLERFKREFEVSKLLPHDHIVEVLDFQPTADGSYALVMEFLYGEELRNTLKREHVMPPERVIRMVSQIALALDGAHSRKLVHRDLKPDNVFLCQTREGDIVKILDFGSVKDKSDPAKKLTVMGTTIGSPFYMAPGASPGSRDAGPPRGRLGAGSHHVRVFVRHRPVQGQQRSQHPARDPDQGAASAQQPGQGKAVSGTALGGSGDDPRLQEEPHDAHRLGGGFRRLDGVGVRLERRAPGVGQDSARPARGPGAREPAANDAERRGPDPRHRGQFLRRERSPRCRPQPGGRLSRAAAVSGRAERALLRDARRRCSDGRAEEQRPRLADRGGRRRRRAGRGNSHRARVVSLTWAGGAATEAT